MKSIEPHKLNKALNNLFKSHIFEYLNGNTKTKSHNRREMWKWLKIKAIYIGATQKDD